MSATEFTSPAAGPSALSLSAREWGSLVEGLLAADRALAAALQAFLCGQGDKEQLRQANTFAAAIHSLCEEVVRRVLEATAP
jgi:hypothetical protein